MLVTFTTVITTVGDSARSLHVGIKGVTWALSGMSLGLAAALLTAGALADNVGRRRVLRWSTVLLAVTSALAAAAMSIEVFVAARVLQGVAGAGMLAASLGAIGHAFPVGKRRTHATAVWGAALGGGIALGPVVAAGLASTLGWRSGYWLQVVAAAALVPATATVSESRAHRKRSFDLPGVITLTTGMACVTAGLVEGRSDWSSTSTLGLLAGGGLLLVAFAALELARREPMLELRLFSEPAFVASVTEALFTGLALIGLMNYLPLLLQEGLHASVLGSAGVLAFWSGTSMIVALTARRLPDKVTGHVRLAVGLAVAAGGELALTGLTNQSSWAQLVPGLAIAGVGTGIVNAALGRLAVESVPHERTGMGSGANNTARFLGGAAGVALVVAVASTHSGHGRAPVNGWDAAALLSAGLCAAGAVIAAACRAGRPAR